jgi:hypothetical protein
LLEWITMCPNISSHEGPSTHSIFIKRDWQTNCNAFFILQGYWRYDWVVPTGLFSNLYSDDIGFYGWRVRIETWCLSVYECWIDLLNIFSWNEQSNDYSFESEQESSWYNQFQLSRILIPLGIFFSFGNERKRSIIVKN